MSETLPLKGTSDPNDSFGKRLASIDALRGFDMLCMIGAHQIGQGLHKAFQNDFTESISNQLTHKD